MVGCRKKTVGLHPKENMHGDWGSATDPSQFRLILYALLSFLLTHFLFNFFSKIGQNTPLSAPHLPSSLLHFNSSL